jgi:Domain of unknown function (DUF4157)
MSGPARSAVFQAAPRNGDRTTAAPRASERGAGPSGSRGQPAGGPLRPSRVPAVPVGPVGPAGRPPSAASAASLPGPLRAGLERLSGLDLGGVRVHYDSARPTGLGALACTHGTQIEVGPGSERHLPHEGWHVVQQLQGRGAADARARDRAAGDGATVGLNEDAGLEREAETMGARARRLGQALGDGPPAGTPARRTGVPAGGGVVQRVKGGIEYTEDGPTALCAYVEKPFPGTGTGTVNQHLNFRVGDAVVTGFLLRTGRGNIRNDDLGRRTNKDFDVMRSSAHVKLTNDVSSAEWVIERHEKDLSVDAMRVALKEDVDEMLAARESLALEVREMAGKNPNPGGEVGITGGDTPNIDAADVVFIYSPGPAKGKAQITAKYTRQDTIRRINKLNASKYLSGTKVAEGEDLLRITGGEGWMLSWADSAGTTSFSQAGVLLDALKNTSFAILQTGGGGASRLTRDQVALVKLMVINDAMAVTMVRYLAALGQAQYVKTIAGADLDATEMAGLRNDILWTAKADAELMFNLADPAALRTVEAFSEYGRRFGVDDDKLARMQEAKLRATDQSRGVPSATDLEAIKDTVLGPKGALLAGNIGLAAKAYTDTTVQGAEHKQLRQEHPA